jgi:hypothetical protein
MPQWEEGDNRVKFISSLGAKHPFTTLAIVPAASIKWNSDIIFLVRPKEATLPGNRSQKGAKEHSPFKLKEWRIWSFLSSSIFKKNELF